MLDTVRGGAGSVLRGVAVAVGALGAGAAWAGPLDRSGQSVAVIFEEGNYVELSLGYVDPSVDGEGLVSLDPLAPLRGLGATAPPLGLAGAGSGDVAESFLLPGAAIKLDLGRGVSAALIYDQPFGADTAYPLGTGFYGAGIEATADTHAVTGLLRRRWESGVSVHGGLRRQTYETAVGVPILFAPPSQEAVGASIATGEPVALDGYFGDGDRDGAWGWVAGAAYEIPALALRVSATYGSEVEHELDTVETGPVPVRSSLPITTPRSLILEFQTGVAPDTLLFGGVRWSDWSSFSVTARGFFAATGDAIVSYEEDTYDVTLGVGRQLTERFAGAVSIGYGTDADGDDEFVSVLGPTAGAVSITLGGTYTTGPIEFSGAVSYARLGDVETTLDDVNPAARFEGNDAVGVFLKAAYRF